ncbi:V-type ATPase 116kDa subunit family protein [Pyramidobacter piscolens W5455]|uniref:V-type ATPase 116kDa subunit family protein n=2 Tax=Pyramidobacter piscolens TaxID=638849 RepID=A0ABM9ZSN0_9BACT|nr:V-type ATP synthase subunit I [Pyramidobacter piscolens]EFB89862.1 V-type ATPase 116kDa subunit family protein [Pyramidobacter piscolens W5455]BDF78290.1 V-type ATP synthase subunit I [Pyramidobacter piscolens]
MAVARVKKIELYVHRTAVEEVLSVLQERGITEISAAARSSAEEPSAHPARSGRDYAPALNDVNYLTRYLAPYYKDPVGTLGRMLGERDDVSVEKLAALADKVDAGNLAAEARKRERRLTELRSDMQQIKSLQQTLSGLGNFEPPLSMITEGSQMVAGFLGTGRAENLQEWKNAVEETLGADAECRVWLPPKGSRDPAWGSVFYLRAFEDKLSELCLKHSVTKIDLPSSLTGTVAEEQKKLSDKLAALGQEEKYFVNWLQTFTDAHMDEIRRLGDYLTIMKTRQDAEDESERTEQVVLLRGWVPDSKAAELKQILVPYEKDIDLQLSDPAEDDDPPIVLENRNCAKPFEMLTMLYGAPVYGSVDPSFPMMPFFLLFFGMCYADAGYGIVITAIAVYFLKKYRKMPEGIKRALILVKYCGIATVIYGAITGSWMGDMIDAFPFLGFLRPVKNLATLLEPMKDPMLLLGISLALGIVHIYYGILLAAYANVKKRRWFAACADQGGWLLLLTGLLIFGVGAFAAPGVEPLGKNMAIAGAVVLILTQGREKKGLVGKFVSGVLSLYNVTSYLGDVLSYSRLLALGLVGGAVAMIINLMSKLCGGTAYVGWILALLIFFGGHVFSMVINILGAFVHPLRLQYVEFFGKFYSSGGTAFDPFCYRSNYVNVTGRKEA